MRRKYFSLALALALHAGAFALAAAFLRPPPPPPAPRVSFAVEGRATPAGAPPGPVAPAAAPPAPAAPRRASPARPAPSSGGGTTAAAPAPVGVSAETGEPAPLSQPAEPGPGAAATGVPGRGSVDPDAIRAAIQARVQYPRLARTQGLEGTVVVRFRLGPGGAPEDLTVVASGGDLLDEAARLAVEKAAPFPAGVGWVRVPIEFALRRP